MTNAKKALKMMLDNRVDTAKCSRQCCKHTQWPIPKDIETKRRYD